MTDDALSRSQSPGPPGTPTGPPGSPPVPAAEDTGGGEGTAADAGHRDIAIDATGYRLTAEADPGRTPAGPA